MNILPKKKWHVRTKENMQRVRRDEAKAAEEEKRILERELLATNEARLDLLRKRAEQRTDTMFGMPSTAAGQGERASGLGEAHDTGGHVNFFADLEQEERLREGGTNKEYEKEKKKEQQEWESKMGIQKALGEGAAEFEGKGWWFQKLPIRQGIMEMRKKEEEQRTANMEKERKSAQQMINQKLAEIEQIKREGRRKRKRRHSSSDSGSESSSSSDSSADSSDARSRKSKKKKKRDSDKDRGKHKKKHKRKKDSSSSSEQDVKKKKKKKHKKSKKEEEPTADQAAAQDKAFQEEKKRKLQMLRDERLKRERMEQAKTQVLLHPELARKQAEEAKKNEPKYSSMFNPEFARKKR